MPVTLILATTNRIVATAFGTVTVADFVAFIQQHRNGGQRLAPLLIDWSAGATDMSSDDLRALALYLGNEIARSGPRGRVAVLAPSDEVFGMMRMLLAYGDMQGVNHFSVFRTMEDAEGWLNEPMARV